MSSRVSLLAMLVGFPLAVAAQQSAWSRGGMAGADYVLVVATGSVFDRDGATLTLRSAAAKAPTFGTITGSAPADDFRGRRVRIVADIEVRNASDGASAWIRVDGPFGMLALENGSEDALTGTGSGHREATVFVPPEATRLVFGLLMRGSGEATARGLRIEARPVIAENAPLAEPARRLLDSAISVVRARALWSDTVTWRLVEPRVRALAAGAEEPRDVYPAIRLLLSSLGDHHSFHMRPAAMQQFRTSGAANPRAEVRTMTDSIGYISVPAYSGSDAAAMKAYVVDAHAALFATLRQTSCRWIVDLRSNTGGNMWPMLGGLRPFLGETGLGSFVSNKESAPLWHARDGVDVPVSAELSRLDSAYVAVLTGPRTASSGEAVTISFIGRPRTRSFGLPTAGLSTANSTILLPDGSMMLLTTSVEADRNGVRYGGRIYPDELIPLGSESDTQLSRATDWLKSQQPCRP